MGQIPGTSGTSYLAAADGWAREGEGERARER